MNTDKVDSCIAFLNGHNSPNWNTVVDRLKPGSHLAAICPLLNHHSITMAIEDCGIEIRDCIMVLGKPSYMVSLGRVPLEGTVAENVLRYGTGALNIDGCRVGTETRYNTPASPTSASRKSRVVAGYRNDAGTGPGSSGSIVTGRWPANCILGGDYDFAFPQSSSNAKPRNRNPKLDREQWRMGGKQYNDTTEYGDKGSAARFFYHVKGHDKVDELVKYLVKLINPPGGKVLFLGSTRYNEHQ